MMKIQTIQTKPFQDQKSGTSGLRKSVKIFQTPHYIENFVQSIFCCSGDVKGKTLIIGGDGRFFNKVAIQIIIKMAAANGFLKAIIGKGGILSTPAVSYLISQHKAHGGIILSASHNPGGRLGDFGIKYNIENGGPAPENIMQKIHVFSKNIQKYFILKERDININHIGSYMIGDMEIKIIDPVYDYSNLMESLIDFDIIRSLVKKGFRFIFDAMHGVTGPYAYEIFEKRLGFPPGTVINGTPLQDFGGCRPDPNIFYANKIYNILMSKSGPDFGAASDADGDRNFIMGKRIFVTPSDSLAILVNNFSLIKGYQNDIIGVARSMPTSHAVDHVAKKKNINVYETAIGWKYFCNLLDSNLISICGEESFGTGSDHIREKDGLWAILMWINLIAIKKKV